MTHKDIVDKALSEIENRNFAATAQFLEIHELVFEGNKPKIERIDTESNDGTAISPVVGVFHHTTNMFHVICMMPFSQLC